MRVFYKSGWKNSLRLRSSLLSVGACVTRTSRLLLLLLPLNSTHTQLSADELVTLLDGRPAHIQRVPDGEQIESVAAPLRHREPDGYTAVLQRLDRALAHGQREPVVAVAVDDEGRGLVVALADLPQGADGLDLLHGGGGAVSPVRGVGGGDVGFVRQTVHEDGDRLRVPAHVQDDLGAVVFQGQGEGHGSLFADGGVFDDLGCTGQLSLLRLGAARQKDTYGVVANACQDVRDLFGFFFSSQRIAWFMPV